MKVDFGSIFSVCEVKFNQSYIEGKHSAETHNMQNTCFLFIRFCTSCSAKQRSSAKFCWKCGSPVQCGLGAHEAGPSQGPKRSFGRPVPNHPKSSTAMSAKSFEDYLSVKKKQQQSGSQFRPRKKAKRSSDENVTISIGLMKIAGNDLKPVWGKRLPIQVPKSAHYARILSQGIEKWVAFDKKFDGEEDYVLLYEDGSHALCLPGQEQEFELEKYKTELGRDYKRVTMYLCTTADFEMSEGTDSTESELSDSKPSTISGSSLPFQSSDISHDKKDTTPLRCDSPSGEQLDDPSPSFQPSHEQVLKDAKLAKVLQGWENNTECFDDIPDHSTNVFTKPSQIVELLADRVDQTQDFFLVTCRVAPFTRTLALWQRQAQKTLPTSVLRVHYSGEAGIDTGAMSQEFLAQVISDMGREMFPDGSPTDSTYHVQNGNYRTCGEIVAVSLAQGGPPPCFLEQCAYYQNH